jgi:hypothetical protein
VKLLGFNVSFAQFGEVQGEMRVLRGLNPQIDCWLAFRKAVQQLSTSVPRISRKYTHHWILKNRGEYRANVITMRHHKLRQLAGILGKSC